MLGEENRNIDLVELIEKAYNLPEKNQENSPIFSFSPAQVESEEILEFPNVQRVITLNDLAPSTQRHLSETPPSLPPRSPKSKGKKGQKKAEEKKLFVLTPQKEIEKS